MITMRDLGLVLERTPAYGRLSTFESDWDTEATAMISDQAESHLDVHIWSNRCWELETAVTQTSLAQH